ncbi:MAG TPA: hypothetical protein VFU74_03740 [Actinocrinis sp.]|nr:hypothetical protein [Actinocrinis sp.]
MQKRHARWIATLAIAGTTAFCGTSAAEAATNGAQSPKQVSPSTCAGLLADYSATLTQAAKSLLATPPDLAAATAQVAQANKLNDAVKSLDCATAGTPSAPLAPSAPSAPGAPSLPGTPSLPAPVQLPAAPQLPSVPNLPAAPGLPGTPSLPSLPSLPGAPSAPSLPGTAGLPGLPGVPGVGSLPVPGLPSL